MSDNFREWCRHNPPPPDSDAKGWRDGRTGPRAQPEASGRAGIRAQARGWLLLLLQPMLWTRGHCAPVHSRQCATRRLGPHPALASPLRVNPKAAGSQAQTLPRKL